MNLPHRWRLTLALGVLAFPALTFRPQPLLAQGNACALVKAADAAALLGPSPTQKATPGGMGCSWTAADGRHKLMVLTYKTQGVPPETAYMGARRGAEGGGGGKLADEPGLGDKAFSGQTSFGAIIVVLKHGRLVQLQYWTNEAGSPRDVAALRPVARKAAAAL